MVLVIALALTVLFGVIGWALKSLMWSASESPKTATDYGRKLGGYFLFVTSLISSHNFIQKEFDEAIVASLVTMIMFTVAGFTIGLLYGSFVSSGGVPDREKSILNPTPKSSIVNSDNSRTQSLSIQAEDNKIIKSNMNNPVATDEEAIWAEALAELEGENRKSGIWAKAFSESGGDDSKARALYLKIRFDDISRHKAALEPAIPISTAQMPAKPSDGFVAAEEASEEKRSRLLNAVRKGVRYEDALALLEDSGFEVKIKPSGFLSPAEYEVWDVKAEFMVFKAISKGLIVQFVKEKFSGE